MLPTPIALADLDARIEAGSLTLDCPKCRTHRLTVAATLDSEDVRAASIVPHRASVLHRGECGVHFFVLDGRAVPAGSRGGWDD